MGPQRWRGQGCSITECHAVATGRLRLAEGRQSLHKDCRFIGPEGSVSRKVRSGCYYSFGLPVPSSRGQQMVSLVYSVTFREIQHPPSSIKTTFMPWLLGTKRAKKGLDRILHPSLARRQCSVWFRVTLLRIPSQMECTLPRTIFVGKLLSHRKKRPRSQPLISVPANLTQSQPLFLMICIEGVFWGMLKNGSTFKMNFLRRHATFPRNLCSGRTELRGEGNECKGYVGENGGGRQKVGESSPSSPTPKSVPLPSNPSNPLNQTRNKNN